MPTAGAATLTATAAPGATPAATTMAAAGDMGGDAAAGGRDMAALERAANKDDKVYTVFDKPNGQMKFKKTGADKETVVQPRFFGRTLAPLAGEGRRDTLARAIVASDLFAKTFVDRTWEQLFGRGIVEPWDDLGGENDAKHPPLLARLADDFRASGYDVKHLLRLLVESRAYGLTSRILASPSASASATPAAGAPPPAADAANAPPPPDPTLSFARAAVRRLTPEVRFQSLIVATGVDRLEQLDADKVRKRIERAAEGVPFRSSSPTTRWRRSTPSTATFRRRRCCCLKRRSLTNQGVGRQRPGSNLARILAASNDPTTRPAPDVPVDVHAPADRRRAGAAAVGAERPGRPRHLRGPLLRLADLDGDAD